MSKKMLFIHPSLSEYQQFKRHSGDVAHLTKSLSLQISSRARQIFNVKYSHYQTRKESEQQQSTQMGSAITKSDVKNTG